jgi:hypothetical protein
LSPVELLRGGGEVLVPEYLGPADHPWLEALLDEVRRFAGRPLHEWHARAAEPLGAPAPERRRRLATSTLERLCDVEAIPTDPTPAGLRERLFTAAQAARDAGPFDRAAVIAAVGADTALDRLYADIPAERRLQLPDPLPDAGTLALLTNLALSQALLRSASQLEIHLGSRSRALLRQILLLRLLCTVRPRGDGVAVEVSGPFSLFRHTTMYGKALASLVPVLRGADTFVIHAQCTVGGVERTVRVQSGDPIFPPGTAPRRYDSKLEERFARDFAKLAPGWDLVREPEPLPVGGAYVFPDFALVDRRDGARRWLLEIIGFWTPDYLAAKLDRLRRSGRKDLILCIDEKLACSEADLPGDTAVVRFDKRVDAAAVLAIVSGPAPAPAPPPEAHHELLGTSALFLDYAGRHPPGAPIHERLAALRPGDPVTLSADGAWILVLHPDGTPLGALSAPGRAELAPRLGRVRGARVNRIVERTREQSTPAFRWKLRVDRWRVPVVEVELEPM